MRQRDAELAPDFDAKKRRRRHTDDRHRVSGTRDALLRRCRRGRRIRRCQSAWLITATRHPHPRRLVGWPDQASDRRAPRRASSKNLPDTHKPSTYRTSPDRREVEARVAEGEHRSRTPAAAPAARSYCGSEICRCGRCAGRRGRRRSAASSTSSCGARTGNVRRLSAFSNWKIAVLAPMPSASDSDRGRR